MGCICSKGSNLHDDEDVAVNEKPKETGSTNKPSVQVIAPLHHNREETKVGSGNHNPAGGSLHLRSNNNKATLESNTNPVIDPPPANVEENSKTIIIERPKQGHQRCLTVDLGGVNVTPPPVIASMPNAVKGEQGAAGWPSWLASVAGEAIQGWTPRSADSYEKLSKIGQGTYSTVYRARDLNNDKIVAMKKVRFVNMDPESVRFMAKEISMLRKLDHPNVMKLEALVTSRISGSLYLVFEYMEHDLAGLLASPKVKFTEPQIKCYMQQMLWGLEHCHSRGVLHRDIKGSNLLVDNKGNLKIGDFGLATTFSPNQKQPLTSRVVTLWYRAPELLLGATHYGVAIDMWSAGCILSELFAGKPIMAGRTEVEQMHKIFKLCGSPTEEYWKKTKFPLASSFKSHNQYKRRVADTFKDFPSSASALIEVLLSIDPDNRGTASSALRSEFFKSDPLPCDLSDLPKYPPSKELDAKLREEHTRRRKAEMKANGTESGRNNSRKPKATMPEVASNKSTSVKFNPPEDGGTGFPIEPPRVQHLENGFTSAVHPNAVGRKKGNDTSMHSASVRLRPSQETLDFKRQSSQLHTSIVDSTNYHHKGSGITSTTDSIDYVPKRNRILCSGPLMPPGGNIEDVLKEHERHIQEAVRKARVGKARTKN